MIGLFVAVIKAILTMLLKTAALKFLHPYLLSLDAWCEKRLGIDIIKQEKSFKERYTNIYNRIEELEKKVK